MIEGHSDTALTDELFCLCKIKGIRTRVCIDKDKIKGVTSQLKWNNAGIAQGTTIGLPERKCVQNISHV